MEHPHRADEVEKARQGGPKGRETSSSSLLPGSDDPERPPCADRTEQVRISIGTLVRPADEQHGDQCRS